jgi:hypothetical protein
MVAGVIGRLLRRALDEFLWLQLRPILERLAWRALSLTPLYRSPSGDWMVYLQKLRDGWMVGVLKRF